MLVRQGIKHKKIFGIKRKIKTLNFHDTFGTSSSTGDFNYDSQLRPQPNQNIPDPVFNTPAQVEGCGGEGIASVMGDKEHMLFSPWFSYSEMCQAEGQPVGNPCNLDFILNEPITSGVQTLTGAVIKSPQWYEVTPLNDSLFAGILSALATGGTSVAFASTWYQSFDTPVNGVVPNPSGQTSGHFWKFCGVKTINGAQYLIAAPWLGEQYGENGFCYFSQAIVDEIGGQAFTPNASQNTEPIPVSVETILESLISFMEELLHLEGASNPQTAFQMFEEDIKLIQAEITKDLTPAPMPETVPEAPQAPTQPVTMQSKLDTFCGAIRDYEGKPGDLNYLLNNPGDCRPSPVGYLAKYQPVTIIDTDTNPEYPYNKGKFAKFPTYAIGWEYLEAMVFSLIEQNLSWTFLDFFAHYSPSSDNNDPNAYAENVAEKCGVPATTVLSTWLN